MGTVTPITAAAPRLTAPAPLTDQHDLSHFDCGKPELDDWLRQHAIKNESRASRTFVVCDGLTVVGYYTLAAGSVENAKAAVPRTVRRNMPSQIPVLLLGRLAVDHRHHGKQIGSGLLKDALKRALSVAENVGARAILVHAIDAQAASFYTQYKFRAFPEGTLTFFLPIEEVAAALD